MRRLLWLEEAHRLPVILDGHAHLGEHSLPLLPHGLGPLHLRLPGLRELWVKDRLNILLLVYRLS